MILECAVSFFGSVAAMDVGCDKLVYFVFGDHELLQDIGAFVVEIVDLEFDSALFQDFIDFYVRGEQVWFYSSSQWLGEDYVGIVVVRD